MLRMLFQSCLQISLHPHSESTLGWKLSSERSRMTATRWHFTGYTDAYFIPTWDIKSLPSLRRNTDKCQWAESGFTGRIQFINNAEVFSGWLRVGNRWRGKHERKGSCRALFPARIQTRRTCPPPCVWIPCQPEDMTGPLIETPCCCECAWHFSWFTPCFSYLKKKKREKKLKSNCHHERQKTDMSDTSGGSVRRYLQLGFLISSWLTR